MEPRLRLANAISETRRIFVWYRLWVCVVFVTAFPAGAEAPITGSASAASIRLSVSVRPSLRLHALEVRTKEGRYCMSSNWPLGSAQPTLRVEGKGSLRSPLRLDDTRMPWCATAVQVNAAFLEPGDLVIVEAQ